MSAYHLNDFAFPPQIHSCVRIELDMDIGVRYESRSCYVESRFHSASMNFHCHALPFLDQPLLAISTGIPDWLSAVDRKIRAREKLAKPFLESEDLELRLVARGITQHIKDDRWFHGTQAFAETNMQLAVQLRDLLPGDAGFRPTFVGHILTEMMLDRFWIRDDQTSADQYYAAIASVPATTIQRCVNVITGKPTDRLAGVIERYSEVRFLYDYVDDDKLLFRLNQVMNRVGLARLPDTVGHWLPRAEKLVESRRVELLTPPDRSNPYHF